MYQKGLERNILTTNYYDAVFHLDKDLMSKKDIRRHLRVQSNKGHRGSTLTADCWEETPTHWKVPRAWAEKQGFHGEDRTPLPKREWPKVSIEYRHNQEECLGKILAGLKLGLGCTRLVAPTSYGKSVFAIEVARQLETNLLVIVPTNEILSQFKINAKEIFGAECGVIKGAKTDTDKLITLTTYQTLARRVDEADYLDKFGLVVVDEAALAGCASIQKILTKVNSRYRLSVSADFYRADGLVKVYELCLGEVVARGVKDKTQSIPKHLHVIDLPAYVDPKKTINYLGEVQHTKYKTKLAESEEFNEKIVEICNKLLEKSNRRILLGISRIVQAETLKDMFGDRAGLFTGTTKEAVLKESATKEILLYSKSNMGFDPSKFIGSEEEAKLAPLNVVIPLSPSANTLQLTGRGGRENRPPDALIILLRMGDYYSRSQVKKDIEKNYKDLPRATNLDEFLEKH